jgi:hypothetical protein
LSVLTLSQDDPPSPPKRPVVHAPRKDADAHFQFRDEAEPGAEPDRPKSHQHQQGMNLYHDSVSTDDSTPIANAQSNTTNTNNSRRGNDFGAHYSMTDSPTGADPSVRDPKRTTRGDMEQHWAFSEPKSEQKIYKTAGDGMGGRKGGTDWMIGESDQKIYKTAGDGMGGRSGNRSWGIGDDSDPEVQASKSGRGRRG